MVGAGGLARPLDGRPYQVVVVPVLAPQPIALVALGFALDAEVLEVVRRLTTLEVSLWSRSGDARPILISTLPEPSQAELVASPLLDVGGEARGSIELGSVAWRTTRQPLTTADDSEIHVFLQRSVEEAWEPLRRLEIQIFTLSAGALLLALAAAVLFARSVSRPLQQLAEGARRIGRGDEPEPLAIAQDDEIGELTTAFNQMVAGIRDREQQIRFHGTHDALTDLPNRTLLRDHLDLTMAVNLSALDLFDAELPTLVFGLLAAADLEPSRLTLEVTESAFMKDAGNAVRVLSELKRLEVSLAVGEDQVEAEDRLDGRCDLIVRSEAQANTTGSDCRGLRREQPGAGHDRARGVAQVEGAGTAVEAGEKESIGAEEGVGAGHLEDQLLAVEGAAALAVGLTATRGRSGREHHGEGRGSRWQTHHDPGQHNGRWASNP